jgi:hypothetical protein
VVDGVYRMNTNQTTTAITISATTIHTQPPLD